MSGSALSANAIFHQQLAAAKCKLSLNKEPRGKFHGSFSHADNDNRLKHAVQLQRRFKTQESLGFVFIGGFYSDGSAGPASDVVLFN